MPYAVLVSALGAIVSTAIALFGLQSWTALKVAPLVGALLGPFFAILSLRRYELPLGSRLESYRSAAGVGETAISFYPALAVGLFVSLIELPSIVFGPDIALPLCIAGWPFLLVGTAYRSWRSNGSSGKLDIFQVIGGIALLVIFGSIMYSFAVELHPGLQAMSSIHLAVAIFVFNGFAAAVASVLSSFGLALISGLDKGNRIGR